MGESAGALSPLSATSRRLAQRLLTIGENRLDLFVVEVQEEREHLLRAILLALGVAMFGLLTSLVLTAAILVCAWAHYPVTTLLTLAALYGAVAVWLAGRLNGMLRGWQTLSATLAELRKDRACLESTLD